jgi:hypothetical protein
MLIYEVITANVGIMNQVIGIWVDTIKESKTVSGYGIEVLRHVANVEMAERYRLSAPELYYELRIKRLPKRY